jgi:hypothetical protein
MLDGLGLYCGDSTECLIHLWRSRLVREIVALGIHFIFCVPLTEVLSRDAFFGEFTKFRWICTMYVLGKALQ